MRLEKIKEFYEFVDKAAAREKINVEELHASYDKLSQAFGPGVAVGMIDGVAKAGAAIGNVQAATLFAIQSLKDLKVSSEEAFDTIVTAATGARIPASELAAAISTISPEMDKLGEHGEKGLRRVAAMFETMGAKAVSAEAATETIASMMDTIGTPKAQKAFSLRGGINLRELMLEGARKGQDPLENFVMATNTALKHIAQREGVDPSKKFQFLDQLFKSPGIRAGMQALIEDAEKPGGRIRTGTDRTRAEEAGATARAADTMSKGAGGDIRTVGNVGVGLSEALGWTVTRPIEWAKKLFEPAARPSPFGALYGPGGSARHNISGNAADIPGMPDKYSRPLIPTASGSATEQTARDQLQAIRDLGRGGPGIGGGFGGGHGIGGSSGSASGGESPSGAGGGGTGPAGARGGGRHGAGGGRTPGASGSGGGGVSPSSGGGNSGRGEFNVKKSYDLIKEAGGTDEEASTLAAIAQAESAGGPRAHNTNARTGDNSYGLWQINMLGAMGPERRRKYGLKSNDELFDPKTNARVALQMKRGAKGYRDWSTYKSGAHRKFLPKKSADASDDAWSMMPRHGETRDQYQYRQDKAHGTKPPKPGWGYPEGHGREYASLDMENKPRADRFETNSGVSYEQDPNMPVLTDKIPTPSDGSGFDDFVAGKKRTF